MLKRVAQSDVWPFFKGTPRVEEALSLSFCLSQLRGFPALCDTLSQDWGIQPQLGIDLICQRTQTRIIVLEDDDGSPIETMFGHGPCFPGL